MHNKWDRESAIKCWAHHMDQILHSHAFRFALFFFAIKYVRCVAENITHENNANWQLKLFDVWCGTVSGAFQNQSTKYVRSGQSYKLAVTEHSERAKFLQVIQLLFIQMIFNTTIPGAIKWSNMNMWLWANNFANKSVYYPILRKCVPNQSDIEWRECWGWCYQWKL